MWASFKTHHLPRRRERGFTIVELLIVIVVIAILAAITIVSYNGISTRARYSVMQQDIEAMNKAVLLYYADNGKYPSTGTTAGNAIGANPAIPGITPTYMSQIPTIPDDGKGGYYAYLWSANGADYKIVRLSTSTANLPSIEATNPNPDTARPGRGWGVWSSGGSGL